jgi:hypothetical protein
VDANGVLHHRDNPKHNETHHYMQLKLNFYSMHQASHL